MSHYGGGSDYSQYQNRPNYDGRRVQKAFERDTIDYNAAVSLHLEVHLLPAGCIARFSTCLICALGQNRPFMKDRCHFELVAPHRINLFKAPALPQLQPSCACPELTFRMHFQMEPPMAYPNNPEISFTTRHVKVCLSYPGVPGLSGRVPQCICGARGTHPPSLG